MGTDQFSFIMFVQVIVSLFSLVIVPFESNYVSGECGVTMMGGGGGGEMVN